MNYRYLGHTGLKVSEICFGTMTYTGNIQNEIGSVNQAEADRLTALALDLGINFFDTADVYSKGNSEVLLGKSLGTRRKEVVVGTKVRFATGVGPNQTGLSRQHILESCENSLRRLNTDYIDLYQVHSFDPGTPLEETLRALDDLVHSGKVRYIGCSNFLAWQTMKSLGISQQLGLHRFATNQLYYSVGARDIEHEIQPLCIDQKIGILCWSPLSGGFFSGKYKAGQALPNDSRRSHTEARSLRYWPVDELKGFALLETLTEVALENGKSVAQTALRWLLQRPAVNAVIAGARKPEQLQDNAAASGWILSEEDMQKITRSYPVQEQYPGWHQGYNDAR